MELIAPQDVVFIRDEAHAARLLESALGAWPLPGVGLGGRSVIETARALARGDLLLVRRDDARPLDPPDSSAVPLLSDLAEPFDLDDEPAPTPQTGWVEVLLTEFDGTPAANEPYKILTQDGDERRGNLDDGGEAHEDDVVRSICRVAFPEIDRGDWQAYPGPPEPEPTFVDVVVTDEDDAPVANAEWELEFPGGETRTGLTDATGRIYIPEVDLASVARLTVTRPAA